METYTTKQYERFSFINYNREVGKLNLLEQSIKEIDLTMYNPIKVTPDLRILDGQHRFEVCKNLGKPIYYEIMDVAKEDEEKVITALNKAQSNWKLPDYLHKWTILGKPNFIEFEKFVTFHKLPITKYVGVAAIIFQGNASNYNKRIKDGTLLPKWEHADDLMILIKSFKMESAMTRHFVEAFIAFYKTHTEKEIKKLCKNILAIPHFANISQYATAFNNIISKR